MTERPALRGASGSADEGGEGVTGDLHQGYFFSQVPLAFPPSRP